MKVGVCASVSVYVCLGVLCVCVCVSVFLEQTLQAMPKLNCFYKDAFQQMQKDQKIDFYTTICLLVLCDVDSAIKF